jgi:hypothetical protein
MGSRVEVNPPVDMLSMKGFRNGMQEKNMAKVSWRVVARYTW